MKRTIKLPNGTYSASAGTIRSSTPAGKLRSPHQRFFSNQKTRNL